MYVKKKKYLVVLGGEDTLKGCIPLFTDILRPIQLELQCKVEVGMLVQVVHLDLMFASLSRVVFSNFLYNRKYDSDGLCDRAHTYNFHN